MNTEIKGKNAPFLRMRICLICNETTARGLVTTHNRRVCKAKSITEHPNGFKHKIFIPATWNLRLYFSNERFFLLCLESIMIR